MITRIEHEVKPSHVVISRQEYETDKQRGYCIIEFAPPRTRVTKNPKNLQQEIRIDIPRVVLFCCMKCHFNVVDSDYVKGSGIDKIREHVWRNAHTWPYTAFRNPYGNVVDVTIEGIEDYSLELKEN